MPSAAYLTLAARRRNRECAPEAASRLRLAVTLRKPMVLTMASISTPAVSARQRMARAEDGFIESIKRGQSARVKLSKDRPLGEPVT